MLKSATVAAKKKNNLNEVIYLTGKEDEQVVAPTQKKQRRSVSTAEPEVVKPRVEKTPSLKATLSQIDTIGKGNTDADQSSHTEQDADKVNLSRTKFSEQDLLDKWELFVEKLNKTDKRMYAALKNSKPALVNDSTVVVSLQNNAQLEEFQARLLPIFQSNLREALNNHVIEIKGSVVDAEKLERPNFLTENEKLQKMIDKNPALQQLRNKFKLDFE